MSDNEETILKPPCEFGRFIVERELGHGGMGGVYLARDKMLDRQVALKVMLKSLGSDPQFIERFKTTTLSRGSPTSPWRWLVAVRSCALWRCTARTSTPPA